ncbi:MAG TPA: archaemetzincin [Myxococcales bacterium]|jgi:archaemetzincin
MRKRILLWTAGAAAVAVTVASLAVAASRKPPRPAGPQGAAELRAEKLEPRFERLKPVHTPKATPQPGEWLAVYPETGQSFEEYLQRKPVRPTPERRTIYFKPIGAFVGPREKILQATAEYTSQFFGLPVKVLEPMSVAEIPEEARRINGFSDELQLNTIWVMEKKLEPQMPKDALALIGLTAVDLYPDPSWNFVFGEALPGKGIGIWSIARFGDPSTPAGFARCLRRTVETATHEIGHLFGVDHCVAWECQMNGSNSLAESDQAPLDVCPQCLQKLTWFSGVEPAQRFKSLARLAREQGFNADAALLEKQAGLVAEPANK